MVPALDIFAFIIGDCPNSWRPGGSINLMLRGCPVGELIDLLFDSRGSVTVLRPSLAPLAAWLCAGAQRWSLAVCRRVIEVAPEALLRFGDPASLAIQDRRALLKALLKKADGRQRLWWEHDQATLSRLADTALVHEISELIIAPSSGQTLRELGLELVLAGKLRECATTVLELAISDLAEGDLFPLAARALEAVGDEIHLAALAAAATEVKNFPERVCVPLCNLLFPRVWSVSQLFRALGRMKPVAHSGIGWDYAFSEHLGSVTNRENALQLLSGLLGHHAEAGDDDDDFEPPSSILTALRVASAMLSWPNLSRDEAAAIAEVLVRAGNRRHYIKEDEIAHLQSEAHPQVREQYFQLAAARIKKEHGTTNCRFSYVTIFYEFIKPSIVDFFWVLSWLRTASTEQERECALDWGLDLWQQTGRPREFLEQIKVAAKEHRGTRVTLRKRLHPSAADRAKVFWYRRIRHKFYRYRFREAWHKTTRPLRVAQTSWNLWRYRHKLRSGEYVGWLARLASEAVGDSAARWTPSDWSLLEAKRGAKCTAAVKQGCTLVWAKSDPPLPHEKQPNEGADAFTIAGLAGIQVAWQEGQLRFSDLSVADAIRATRYALNELNGFPAWFFDTT